MRAISALLFCFSTFFSFSQQYDYAKLLGGVAGDARGQGIVRDNAGNIFMKGVFTGGLQIGSSIYNSDKGDAFFCKNDIAGNFQWFKKVGFTQAEDWANTGDGDIAIDASNNIYIIGSYFGNATIEGNSLLNAGGYDTYVIKYDENGNLIWVRTLGGSDDEGGNGIAVDAAGNVYVSGGTYSTTINFNSSPQATGKASPFEKVAYVASLNPDGTDNWITFKQTNSQRNEFSDLVFDGVTNLLVTGKVNRRAHVARYDASSGAVDWETTATNQDSEGYGIAFNGNSVFVGGDFSGGDLAFSGLSPIANLGANDIFIAEFDMTLGTPLNMVTYGTAEFEGIRDISIAGGASPVLAVTGYYNNGLTIGALPSLLDGGPFIATFDLGLAPQLAAGMERKGDNFLDTGLGLEINTSDNAIYSTGTYSGAATVNSNLESQKWPTFFIQRHKASTLAIDFSKISPHGEIVAQFIETDNADNIYLAGYFDGSVNLFGTRISSIETSSDASIPLHDLFVAKLNPDASLDWVATAGGLDNDLVYGLTIDGEGSVYINAEFPNTATVAGTGSASGKSIVKLDNTGAYVYAASFPAAAEITAIEGDKYLTSDKLYAVGYFTGSIDLQGTILNTAGPDTDIFIVRLDGSGVITPATIKQYGGPGDDIASDITQIFLYSATEMLVTGSIQATVDFNGTMLTADGTDIFVTRIDEFLNAFDSFNDGGPGDQEGLLVSPDASNNVLVAGNFYGTADFNASTLLNGGASFTSHFIAKYQNNGSFIWAKEIVSSDASSNNFLTAIATDGNDNIFLSGTLTKDLNFDGNVINALGDNDGFIVQYDIGGNYVFADALGSNYASGAEAFIGFEYGYGVATTSNDEIWITGTLAVKEETFGPYTLKPYAVDDPGQSYGMDSYLTRYNTLIVPTAGSKIYWTEEVGNQINRCNLDGTFFEQYYSGFSIFPQGIACDEANGFMYWTDTNGKVRRGQVGATSFDFFEDFIDEHSSSSRRDNLGISIDEAGDKIYWVSNWDGTIKSATLSAPVPISTLLTPVTGLTNPISVAIDPAAGMLYYTENIDAGAGTDNLGELHRYDLGVGSDVTLFSRQTPGEDFRFNDIKLDLANNTIYWSGGINNNGSQGPGEIFYADLSDVSGTVTTFPTPGLAVGIDLDIDGGKIYWVDRGVVSALPVRIMRANLDGSNQEILREGASENIFSPNFLAVEIENLAPPTPLTLVSSTPASNANNVPVNSNITFTFDQDVDGTTANSSNILITGDQTGQIQGTFSGGGSPTIVFNPDNDFKSGELIQVSITTNIQSTMGGALSKNHYQSFVVASGPAMQSPAFFVQRPIFSNGLNVGVDRVVAIDVNQDGNLDVAAIYDGIEGGVAWYENNGSQVFTRQIALNSTFSVSRSVAAADLDLDGDVDLLSAQNGALYWYENDGAYNFTQLLINLVGIGHGIPDMRIADINGDGYLDIVTIFASGVSSLHRMVFYINSGTQTFTRTMFESNINLPQSLELVDMDEDGDVDFTAAGVSGEVGWYENDGSLNFTPHTFTNSLTSQYEGFAIGDFNGDGHVDMAATTTTQIVWMENDGAGNFSEHIINLSIGNNDLHAADIDGDGDLDLVGGGGTGFRFYENDGAGNFTPRSTSTSTNIEDVFAADVDSDGDMDVVIGGQGSIVAWFENTISGCSSPPTSNAGSDQTICIGASASLTGAVTNTSSSTWTTSGDGSFGNLAMPVTTYAPGANDISSGAFTLTLTANDPDGAGPCTSASSTVNITIAPPIAAGSTSISSNIGVANNVNVVAVSTINAGDVITTTITQNPTKGSVAVQADNTLNYTANNGTVGADSFQYQICNQCGSCSNGTVSIDILNEPPVISSPPAPITTVVGQIVVIPFSTFISDLNNNIDFSTIQVVSGPTSTATTSFDSNYDLTVDYANVGFVGTDALTIEVCDLLGACAQITLSIEVDGSITPFNGISPNGDGFNDYFNIANIQFIEPQNKVSIYNRWGDKVFDVENYDNTNPDRRFNGISNSGKELASGVYFYKVEFPSGRATLTGYLTIKK